MLNNVILIKVKQRLNKLDSSDYDNIESWQILEAFNKAQVDWCRRNLHGTNQLREGDEQSNRRIDDMQVMLVTVPIDAHQRTNYFETDELPSNYFQWKRISAKAKLECCPARRLTVYLTEEGNLDVLLSDVNKQPNFDWAETFATIKNNRIYIYTDGVFEIDSPRLTYYRQPRKIEISGIVDPYTGDVSTTDVLCQFKDDVIELFIDESVKILSGDIESLNQAQRSNQSVEANN